VATRNRSRTTKAGRGIPTFAQLVREGIAAGHSRQSAEAHARKILASYDVIEVDVSTGKWRFVTGGPSIMDVAKTPARKRPEGKTRKRKGAE
jgi:hypothetical protein